MDKMLLKYLAGMCFGIALLATGLLFFINEMGESWKGEKRKEEIHLNDDDIILIYKTFSPDTSKVAIVFAFNQGAFGNSSTQISILNTIDTIKELGQFSVENYLNSANPTWIGSDTLLIMGLKDTVINQTVVIVYKKDTLQSIK